MIEVTGTVLIRGALRARDVKTNVATVARNVGISASELDAFIADQLELPPQILLD